MKKILVLFPNEWDKLELASPRFRATHRFFFAGFDVFKFPENARLLTFDALKFIDRIVFRYRKIGLDGVFSTDEQFGAMIAASVAVRLGLPGADPLAILISQHKYYSRRMQQRLAPEATPRFSVFPYAVASREDIPLAFPFFVKPVKATFSILSRRVDDFAQLKDHLTFGPFEKLILERLIRPFNDLAQAYSGFAIDAHHLVAEEVLDGVQVCVDGYAHDGRVEILGVVDSIMYPGTIAFQRFDYPSRLPDNVIERMKELAVRLARGMGMKHGMFNLELYYQPATDSIKIIELNPRLAYQFADLYEKVEGFNTYDILISLSLGEAPVVARKKGAYKHAASFILRDFAGNALKTGPNRAELARLQIHHDARVMVYAKKGASLAREIKWLGSYRYATMNIGGASIHDLFERFHYLRDQIQFELA